MTRYLLRCVGFLILLSGMPAVAQEEYNTEALWGTWADDTASSGLYKLQIDPDGKMLQFVKESGEPYREGRYSIEAKWTDDLGNDYYQCRSRWGFYPFDEAKGSTEYFILFKIDISQDLMQSLWSTRRYPDLSEIDVQPGYRRQ
jgi:hypothetical protein